MKQTFTLIVLTLLLCAKSAYGKDIKKNSLDTLNRKGLTLYINQPIGFINKVRIKTGYKSEKNSTYLVSLTNHYNNINGLFTKVKYTGLQFCIEYQHALNKGKHGEIFVYGKTGIGNYVFKKESNFIFSSSNEVSGSYYIFGGGIGDELFLNKSKTVFIQSNVGFKICDIYKLSTEKPEETFKTVISPGSVIEININFGFRF
jgi:hypothetical protein